MTITVGDLLRAGLASQRAGRAAVAEEAYRRVLAFDPRQPDALHLLGALALERGMADEALGLLTQAVEIAPERGEIHLARAVVLARLSRAVDAAGAFAAAARFAPDLTQAHHGLGRALVETNAGDPMPHYRRALALAPDQALVWNDLGVAVQAASTMGAALSAYGRAVALAPQEAFALRNLAGALAERKRGLASLRRYRQALALAPSDATGLDGLAALVTGWGDLDEAHVALCRAVAIEDPPGEAWSHYLFFLNYLPGLDFASHFRANRRWGERVEARVRPQEVFANPKQPERRLRLAYVAPDLVAGHNQLAFLTPPLTHHDRTGFDVAVYTDVTRPDSGTAAMAAAAGRLVSIANMSPTDQAARVRADGIDIAINVCGWRADARALFAHRLAPIQFAYNNHVSTTGLREIDFRFSDNEVDPVGVADPYYIERLIRLASGFDVYQPPSEAPEVTTLPALRNGFITFGSANLIPKMSAPTYALWARILGALPNARLQVKAGSLGDPWARHLVRRRFSDLGIAPERIELLGGTPDVAAHFRALGEIDIGLDPFPFVGGKTTCDTLWMGVPVVTLAGICMMGRVGVSVLTRAGLPELVASDEQSYIDLALDLARDVEALAARRHGLRTHVAHSKMFDGLTHTRELEGIYRSVWRDWCQRR